MASIGCTNKEIASVLNVSTKTIQRSDDASETIKAGHEKLRASLRRMQFTSANNGNVTMQIWLGKQFLNQKDRQEISTDELPSGFELAEI